MVGFAGCDFYFPGALGKNGQCIPRRRIDRGKLHQTQLFTNMACCKWQSCPSACPGRWLLYWLSCPCKSKAKQGKQGGWAVAPAVAPNRRRRIKGSECIKGLPRNYARIMQQHAMLHMPLCCPPTRGGGKPLVTVTPVTYGKFLARTAGNLPY